MVDSETGRTGSHSSRGVFGSRRLRGLLGLLLAGAVLLGSAAFAPLPPGIISGHSTDPGEGGGPRFSTPPAAAAIGVEQGSLGNAGALPAACLSGPAAAPMTDALPALDALAPQRWLRVPILMYHYIEPPAPGLSVIERGLTVRPDDFAAQMLYLHDHGYVTISLDDLVEALRTGRALPARAVVLTFDGGHRSLLRYALPAMQPYGFTGTIFVITKGIDLGDSLYLTWEQAKALHAQGWMIEPHTRTHQQLAGADRALQWSELCGSIADVAAHVGSRPHFIAYPSGKYDALTLELVRALGLWGGLTVRGGRWHSLWSENLLARVRINGPGSLPQFALSLEGDLSLAQGSK